MPRDGSKSALKPLTIIRSDTAVQVVTPAYRLELPVSLSFDGAPVAVLSDIEGRTWSRLSLLASAHTQDAADETTRITSIVVEPVGDGAQIRVDAASSRWKRRVLVIDCARDHLAVRLELEGFGSLGTVTVFGGRGALPNSASGVFRSSIAFRGVLAAAATEPVGIVRPSAVPAVLGVIGDADAGRLNAVFSPPPLVFGLSRQPPTSATEVPAGDWWGIGVRAPVESLTMTSVRYSPLDGGFLLALEYEGHTIVEESWVSPTLVLRPSLAGWDVLDDYRRDLAGHGFAPQPAVYEGPSWWTEPIFCGWGAQCARSADPAGTSAGVAAPSLARADVYDEFLTRLDAHHIDPGTIVIDDRWQRSYGTGEVDTEQWPDLRGWIAARHAEGRRVLLWWKAWDAQGIPSEECVRTAEGHPVTVDPGSAAYRARLAGIIRDLLSPEGLDADGLKIDFTQRGPSGQSLVGTPNVWGISALHRLLETIAESARGARPDPLLVGHAVHPSFADVIDMVRLNDITERDVTGEFVPAVDQLRMRHAIASRVLPGKPIDTDQWPMPDRAAWLAYAEAQPQYGVPALYYLESIDGSHEPIRSEDLARIADSWAAYRRDRP